MSALAPAFHTEAPWVPYPANLLRLLRPDHPSRHWASLLRSIFSRTTMARYDYRQHEDCKALRKLLERDCTNPEIAHYVLRLVPVQSCAHCAQPFLAEQGRERYCSQRCLWSGKHQAQNSRARERRAAR